MSDELPSGSKCSFCGAEIRAVLTSISRGYWECSAQCKESEEYGLSISKNEDSEDNLLASQSQTVREQPKQQVLKRKNYRRMTVFAKYAGRCAYCGDSIEYKSFHVEHAIPLSRSDVPAKRSSLTNLLPSCQSCNKLKGKMTLEEFKAMAANLYDVLLGNSKFELFCKLYGIDGFEGYDAVEYNKPLFYFEQIGFSVEENHDTQNQT